MPKNTSVSMIKQAAINKKISGKAGAIVENWKFMILFNRNNILISLQSETKPGIVKGGNAFFPPLTSIDYTARIKHEKFLLSSTSSIFPSAGMIICVAEVKLANACNKSCFDNAIHPAVG